MINNQYMLMGIPSSGTDWMAHILQSSHPFLTSDKVAKEYFNPICNPRHWDQLRKSFGCELIDTYRNIADRLSDREKLQQAEQVYMNTWVSDGQLNFSKETFCPFQVQFFADRFTMIGMVRDACHTFPPARLRVLNWYNTIWQSLAYHQRTDAWAVDSMIATMVDRGHAHARKSLLHRAVIAHAICRAVVIRDLAACGVTFINWREVMVYDGDELMDYLRIRLPEAFDVERVVREMIATRLPAEHEIKKREAAFVSAGLADAVHLMTEIGYDYGAKKA